LIRTLWTSIHVTCIVTRDHSGIKQVFVQLVSVRPCFTFQLYMNFTHLKWNCFVALFNACQAMFHTFMHCRGRVQPDCIFNVLCCTNELNLLLEMLFLVTACIKMSYVNISLIEVRTFYPLHTGGRRPSANAKAFLAMFHVHNFYIFLSI